MTDPDDRDDDNDDGGDQHLVTSRFRRTLRAATASTGMLARLAGASLKRRLAPGTKDPKDSEAARRAEREHHEAIAREALRTFGQLKGAITKVGQMVSYLDLGLPEPLREALSGLQDSVPPMAQAVIDQVVTQELGQPPTQAFAEWDPRPIAAASIGQVHRARTQQGAEVAVKVQYPDIVRALEADLRNTQVLSVLQGVILRGVEVAEIAGELRDQLLSECDFRLEAKNQQHFAALYAADPDIVVPQVHGDRSAGRVLTTQFIHGARFRDFATSATQAQKDRAGAIIWRMAFESIFRHGTFNCDPHPGNYLFLPDGRVAFLDFGCVKHFEPAFLADWKALMRAFLEGDRATFREMLIKLRLAPAGGKGFDFDYQYEVTRYLYRPWLTDRPFRYTHDYVRESVRVIGIDNPNRFRTHMPRELLFVNRLQWGLNSVLASLQAEGLWRRPMLELLYGADSSRWPPPFPSAGAALS